MARTFIRQVSQIGASDTYDDTIVPSQANFETVPANIEDDLNRLRSRSNDFLNRDGGTFIGNWWDLISTPSSFENGRARGIDPLNQDLHDMERKRIVDRVSVIGANASIAVGGDRYAILSGAQLPGNTTMAVGTVATLGTITAAAVSFGSAELTEVAGANAIRPLNLCPIWHASGQNVGDPVEDGDGVQIYGLLQSESAVDGHTALGTTPDRLQLSFVKINSTSDDLILITTGEMDGVTFDYAPVERFAWSDLPEYAFLGTSFVDSGVANATRQLAYENQGTAPAVITGNATLQLNGSGVDWSVTDQNSDALLSIVENSGTGASTLTIGSALDLWFSRAVATGFLNGVTIRTSGLSPIEIGVTDGLVRTNAGDMRILGTAELLLDDGNRTGSSWVQAGIKVSDTTAEWETYRTNFGESSLLEGVNATFLAGTRVKVESTLTADVVAGNDVNGPTFAGNCTVDLPPFDTIVFADDVDVFLNGEMMRGSDVGPGSSPANGDLQFTFDLEAATTAKPDQLTVITYGQ